MVPYGCLGRMGFGYGLQDTDVVNDGFRIHHEATGKALVIEKLIGSLLFHREQESNKR